MSSTRSIWRSVLIFGATTTIVSAQLNVNHPLYGPYQVDWNKFDWRKNLPQNGFWCHRCITRSLHDVLTFADNVSIAAYITFNQRHLDFMRVIPRSEYQICDPISNPYSVPSFGNAQRNEFSQGIMQGVNVAISINMTKIKRCRFHNYCYELRGYTKTPQANPFIIQGCAEDFLTSPDFQGPQFRTRDFDELIQADTGCKQQFRGIDLTECVCGASYCNGPAFPDPLLNRAAQDSEFVPELHRLPRYMQDANAARRTYAALSAMTMPLVFLVLHASTF